MPRILSWVTGFPAKHVARASDPFCRVSRSSWPVIRPIGCPTINKCTGEPGASIPSHPGRAYERR